VGSARGLARLYADALPNAATPIARPETFRAMAQQQVWGSDRTLNVPNAFGVVFMIPQPRMPFAGLGAFGHDGAGGALAFADPSTDISFGYIPVPMQYPGGADLRSIALARLVREIATAGGSR
jgi:CubicO group peptidase (beta-lactamase class C family)